MTENNLLGAFGSILNLSEASLDFPVPESAKRGRFNGIKNPYFSQTETRFTRKKYETEINSSLTSVLSVRLREGYTVNSVKINEESNLMEVKLTLPWKINSFIHYTIQAYWPIHVGCSHFCEIYWFWRGIQKLFNCSKTCFFGGKFKFVYPSHFQS